MLKTVDKIDFSGKKVFVRVDFNVPIKEGVVTDDTRIREALKTINYIKERGGLVSLASHLGRPGGEKNMQYSLKPVADYINSKDYLKVRFVDDCIGDDVKNAIKGQESDTVLLLENLRFYFGEERKATDFAHALASNYDVYVNDAFGTCHRKHTSVYGMPQFMKEKAAGFLIQKEVEYLGKIVASPDRPFAAILGGAKVSDKIGVIESLLDKADKLLIGGAMAYTFLKYKGYKTGSSRVEEDQMDTVKQVLNKSSEEGVPIVLPVDHIISDTFCGKPFACDSINIPDGYMGLDIGPATLRRYKRELQDAKTVLWNGPMGVFESEDYAKGTVGIAKFLAEQDLVSVVGGGDSVAAVNKAGVADKISHISTGGGASLEYVEYGKLPGIEILEY